MYLSRVRLDIKKRKTMLALASPNMFHGAIETSFSVKQNRNLWRIDHLCDQTYLLLLSVDRPDLCGLIKQFGFQEDKGEIKEYGRFLQRVVPGSIWHFRLAANPTYSIGRGVGIRGKVTAHVSEKHQLEWLEKKAEQNGFEIDSDHTQIVASDWKIFRKKDQGSMVRVKEVVFEGILTVIDSELCKKALVQGIGREKVYGMGLLTLVTP